MTKVRLLGKLMHSLRKFTLSFFESNSAEQKYLAAG